MVTVRTFKYDGSAHRSWSAELLAQDGALLVLDAVFTEEIAHDLLGNIPQGTSSVEYYWLDRWYNVFKFATPGGELKSYYCNINLPPQFDGRILRYVDLDIDLLVKPDLTFRILDTEDFERNAALFNYPAEVRRNAHQAVEDLTVLINTRTFPFDQ